MRLSHSMQEADRQKWNYKLKSIVCKRCSETISPGMNFCSKCSLPVNLNNEYTREMGLEQDNKILKEKYNYDIKAMREEMEKPQPSIKNLLRQLRHVKIRHYSGSCDPLERAFGPIPKLHSCRY